MDVLVERVGKAFVSSLRDFKGAMSSFSPES